MEVRPYWKARSIDRRLHAAVTELGMPRSEASMRRIWAEIWPEGLCKGGGGRHQGAHNANVGEGIGQMCSVQQCTDIATLD